MRIQEVRERVFPFPLRRRGGCHRGLSTSLVAVLTDAVRDGRLWSAAAAPR